MLVLVLDARLARTRQLIVRLAAQAILRLRAAPVRLVDHLKALLAHFDIVRVALELRLDRIVVIVVRPV